MLLPSTILADDVVIAAASDLSVAIKEIIRDFEQATGHRVKLTLGSSGNFHTQIANGAPFDLYLSADLAYVRELEKAAMTEPGTVFVYAAGRIVVWVPNRSSVDISRQGIRALLDPSIRRIAIANPRHAPYGQAAVAAMEHFGVYSGIEAKLVLGENISQAAQFVSSGAAEAGVIALSLALSDSMRPAGRYWEVPVDAYPRLDQAMVILRQARRANHFAAAKGFHDWIRGERGRAVLEKYGYSRPAAGAR